MSALQRRTRTTRWFSDRNLTSTLRSLSTPRARSEYRAGPNPWLPTNDQRATPRFGFSNLARTKTGLKHERFTVNLPRPRKKLHLRPVFLPMATSTRLTLPHAFLPRQSRSRDVPDICKRRPRPLIELRVIDVTGADGVQGLPCGFTNGAPWSGFGGAAQAGLFPAPATSAR